MIIFYLARANKWRAIEKFYCSCRSELVWRSWRPLYSVAANEIERENESVAASGVC